MPLVLRTTCSSYVRMCTVCIQFVDNYMYFSNQVSSCIGVQGCPVDEL